MSKFNIYSETFTIRASEVDQSGKITLAAVCSIFQEVAGNNALQLNFDITHLHKLNMTWVLSRLDINIHVLPQWRQTVVVETWPASGDAYRAYRNYRILDGNGKELINCLSYWIVLSLETRRPVRLPELVLGMNNADIENVTPLKKSSRMRPFSQGGSQKEILVRRSDLDMNNHVNNVRYLEWMIETIDPEDAARFTNFDIMFMREAFIDAKIVAKSRSVVPDLMEFNITDDAGKLLAIAQAKVQT